MNLPLNKLLFYVIKMLEAEIEQAKEEIHAKQLILEQLKKNRGL